MQTPKRFASLIVPSVPLARSYGQNQELVTAGVADLLYHFNMVHKDLQNVSAAYSDTLSTGQRIRQNASRLAEATIIAGGSESPRGQDCIRQQSQLAVSHTVAVLNLMVVLEPLKDSMEHLLRALQRTRHYLKEHSFGKALDGSVARANCLAAYGLLRLAQHDVREAELLIQAEDQKFSLIANLYSQQDGDPLNQTTYTEGFKPPINLVASRANYPD